MTFKLRVISDRAVLMAGVLGMSIAGFAGSVGAQSEGEQTAPSSEAAAVLQALQTKQQEIQQLMSELREIQKQATEANPELAAEQEDFRDLVIDAMSGQNFDPETEIQDIRTLQGELLGSDQLGEAERQAKMQELEQKTQQFRTKQQQAMEAEDVQAARQELDQNMKAAMKEQDPEAAEMIAQLEQLQEEYQSLMKEVMRQQQQGNADSPQG